MEPMGNDSPYDPATRETKDVTTARRAVAMPCASQRLAHF